MPANRSTKRKPAPESVRPTPSTRATTSNHTLSALAGDCARSRYAPGVPRRSGNLPAGGDNWFVEQATGDGRPTEPGPRSAMPPLATGSWATNASVRRTMQANKGRDTGPEMAIRRALYARGMRYRVDYRIPFIPRRRIDIAFVGSRIAVFIDGCFWHRCPDHYVSPKTNSAYWNDKTMGNLARDRDTTLRLENEGWTVLRFWEHEEVETVAQAVHQARRAKEGKLNGRLKHPM